MSNHQGTFCRYEKKYILSHEQYQVLMARLHGIIDADEFCRSTICNVYYDTPDFQLIRTSLEKPVYKEKLRMRSYGVPNDAGKVFVEVKKKYNGIVYKRRVSMRLDEAESYLLDGLRPRMDTQILRELDWFQTLYKGLRPVVNLSYDREAYFVKESLDLRVTFDTNILWRQTELGLSQGIGGSPLLQPGCHLMELKIPGAMPIWLSALLNEEKIFSVSYSKYGSAYKQILSGEIAEKGGQICA